MGQGTDKVLNRAYEVTKFVSASEEIKLDILAKYGLLADVIYGGSSKDIILLNKETFGPLFATNVINWVFTEKPKPVYAKAVQLNPRLAQLFSSEANAFNALNILGKEVGFNIKDFEVLENVQLGLELFGIDMADSLDGTEDVYDEGDLDDVVDNVVLDDDIFSELVDTCQEQENIQEDTDEGIKGEVYKEGENTEEKDEVEGYISELHSPYYYQIKKLLNTVWEELYANYVNGAEIINGFIVPGGSILSTGKDIRYDGILTLNTDKIEVKPNIISNAIYEEFIESCKICNIPIIKEVADDDKDIKVFKYNPLLQRKIASGMINKEAFNKGWSAYSTVLMGYMDKILKRIAIERYEQRTDKVIYDKLSPYTISLVVVNYKDNLGTLLRFSCGDVSKTQAVANTLVQRLRLREKSHRSISQGSLIVGDPVISDSGFTATIALYQNMAGYQSVPQFMGELLCSLKPGMFKPSLTNMIIGRDLNNKVVTAPFTKWLLPIIAGSRSGKGVLTLNMLLNVIGTGTPLFYLDGKPDMAALIWKLQEKHGIQNSIVIDGIGYKGVTDIDKKPYIAPYASSMEKAMRDEKANDVLMNNFGVMVYLKTMMVVLLSTRYYTDVMGSKYGDIFVVFDEVYKVMKTQLEVLVNNINMEIEKTDKNSKDRKDELKSILFWVKELLTTYIGNDIGVFGAGIKAVALTQFAQDSQYNIPGFTVGKTFCTNFLLKRGVKLFGRQEGGSGTYGVARDKGDDIKFDLYDKYFHFGIGTEQGNTYNNLKTFKPLLVLNEADCKELTGADKDGPFIDGVIQRISNYVDVDQFRELYFTNKELAESIGFEGALAQVGRLIGADWREMLRLSLERAYEISDQALRYYGIIGVDGIDNVYDYICSFRVEHLWSYNEIIKAKAQGKALGEHRVVGDESDVDNAFDMGGEEDDEEIDYGDIGNKGNNGGGSSIGAGVGAIGNGVVNSGVFNGNISKLSDEEAEILKSIQERKTNGVEVDLGNIGNMTIKDESEIFDTNIQAQDNVGNSIDGSDSIDDRYSNVEAKPEEAYTESQVFNQSGQTGKRINVNPSETTRVFKITPENSIIATLPDNHPLEKFERTLFKTLKGADYEFSKRWDAILRSISNRINAGLVNRVLLTQDEMYVNGRLVCTINILGGFENIRLIDIVNFRELFKRFPNIADLTIDMAMLERIQLEKSNLPAGFFEYSPKLMKVNILLDNGAKEVINRGSVISQQASEVVEKAKFKSQFEAVCASKNPRFSEKPAGYKGNVWKATKTFGSKGWESIQYNLTKQDPSFIKAAAIGTVTIGVVAIGGLIHGIGSLFNLFRR